MPHQCVKCSNIYENGAKELLSGCSCGGRFFFFVRQEDLGKAKEITENLTENDKKQIEKDVLDIVGEQLDKEKPVILDLESIRIRKPGKFELDLVGLFKGEPLVYKLEDGKFMIDIVSTFSMGKKIR